MFFVLLIVFTCLAAFFATAAMSSRVASRTTLTELREQRNLRTQLETFFQRRREFIRICLAYQLLFFVAFIVTLTSMLRHVEPWYLQQIYFWAVSLIWLLLFNVAVPAAWSRYAADQYLLRTLPLLEVVRRASRGLLVLIAAIDEIVRRLAGAPLETNDGSDRIEREILDVVSQGETSGAVDAAERDMIRSVMVLDETSVGEIMTPRTDIVGIEAAAKYDDARRLILTDGHSRIPVFEESLDHIVGVLYAKDLLKVESPDRFHLRAIMREVTFVPETKDLASLLREFQTRRVHIAIVLDEYGGTAGLVTLEDIFEELVGDISDEHEQPEAPSILRIDDRTLEIDARTRVDEFNEQLPDVQIPEDEAYDTVGGFVFARLGRIPARGESLRENGFVIDVLEADERTVGRLRIKAFQPAPEESRA